MNDQYIFDYLRHYIYADDLAIVAHDETHYQVQDKLEEALHQLAI